MDKKDLKIQLLVSFASELKIYPIIQSRENLLRVLFIELVQISFNPSFSVKTGNQKRFRRTIAAGELLSSFYTTRFNKSPVSREHNLSNTTVVITYAFIPSAQQPVHPRSRKLKMQR